MYEASGCSEDWSVFNFILKKFFLNFVRSKEVAKINHTFVIELRPDITDHSGMGFEYPEEKIQQAASEIYDGFLEYIKTFIGSSIKRKILNECRTRLNWIKGVQDYE